jgi:peptidoglycan hydrolase CwlO-like protein
MISDDLARQLHDRATRGESLSTKEQALLEEWYASQDGIESQALGLTTKEKRIETLQAQVEAALTQLRTITTRMQEIASENETLRQEIALLRRQLVQQPPVPSAI